MLMRLIRFGISIPENLSKKFDQFIRNKKYSNRSEAIRDLIRNALVQEEVEQNAEVVAVVSLLYDHHKRELSERLIDLQHSKAHMVLTSTHIHLDHDNCIEVIIMRGESQEIKQLADALIASKGVKHGTLEMSSTGKYLD
jgi:CopG family nickel-responsive transcriptional regulator